MPRRRRSDGGFRFNRCSGFFTYSDAAAIDNDDGKQTVVKFFLSKWPACRFLVAREIHPESGEPHFHAVIRWTPAIDTSDSRCFDINGVHPHISPNSVGAGAEKYCIKDGDWDSNYYACDPFTLAANAPSVTAALDILWKEKPREMLLHGENIESNLRKKLKPQPPPALQFFGPFEKKFYPPEDWDPTTHSLLILGPPGIGKTQFAKYYFGEYEYFKSSPERLKDASWSKPLILDEFNYLTRDPEQSKEVTDVISGGLPHVF